MATAKRKTQSTACRLKITLQGSKPPIWRRIEVPGNTSLDDLNLMIQGAMGWTNSHLHGFEIGGENYSILDPEFGADDCLDETKFRLQRLVPVEKAKFTYTYDWGDGWEHLVLVEKIMPPEPGVEYPRCVAGARACPPEDVGGVWGYAEFLEAISDPKHERHEESLEWIGGEFDPEAFDLAETNEDVRNWKGLRWED